MTRLMGDAIHDNVPQLAAAGPWELVAGYVTGSPDIKWTTADWAQFPTAVQVSIDQGFTGSPVLWAAVRDVEQFAWTVPAAVDLTGWTAARPTIYISRSRLPELEQAGWRGDVWVADWTGNPPAVPPTVPAGMTCVAVQYANGAMLGTNYDLSTVFDPAWPAKGDPVEPLAWQAGTVMAVRSSSAQSGWAISGVGTDNVLYVADLNSDGSAQPLKALTFPLTFAPITVHTT